MPFNSPPINLGGINDLDLGLDGSTPDLGSVTYLKVRAYLYKFAPLITATQVQSPNVTETATQHNISRFTYDLNPADLFRFDISGFVSAYTTNQEVGMAGAIGKMSGSVVLQDAIIPFNSLTPTPSAGSIPVRRPIFFPDVDGSYLGWSQMGVPATSAATDQGVSNYAFASSGIPTVDPVTDESVSTVDEDELIERLAMLQTMEDNGGDTTSSIVNSSFYNDVLRIQIAVRLRGIKDPRKQQLLIKYIEMGSLEDELLNLVPLPNQAAFVNSGNPTLSLNNQLACISLCTDKTIDGIYLSDLVQKRDFLSIFVYNQLVPAESIETAAENIDPFFFDKESMFMYTPNVVLGLPPNGFFEMYTAEFSGFVEGTSFSKTTGEINNLSVDLIGSMGLFGATQRIYNSTIYQGTIFDASETYDVDIISLFANIFQGKDPFTILGTLLDSIYLLRVSIPQKPDEIELTDEEQTAIVEQANKLVATAVPPLSGSALADALGNYITLQQDAALTLKKEALVTQAPYRDLTTGSLSSFGDILSLRAFNQFGAEGNPGPKHIFNMSTFLYLNVMRMRRFNMRLPSSDDVSTIGQHAEDWPFDATKEAIPPLAKQTDGSGGSILEINPALDTSNDLLKIPFKTTPIDFKPYFLMLNDGLANYNPGIRTPFEIMNDVGASCFLELFETPGGRFIFRTPQYNNNQPIATQSNSASATPASMITSSDIVQMSSSYSQTVSGLYTKQQLGYGTDINGQLLDILYYFYSNGKLVSQYGLQMGASNLNPNVRTIPQDLTSKYKNGIFQYCRFFLEYYNMQLLTGRISVMASPLIQAGKTYFDVANQKFGYIRRVSKSLTVGGTYTATMDLIAVRDATIGSINGVVQPSFRRIPEMEDFVPLFGGQPTPATNLASYQTQATPPQKVTIFGPLTGATFSAAGTPSPSYFVQPSKNFTSQ